jgi:DNA-binding IclR family transcriptional regulator
VLPNKEIVRIANRYNVDYSKMAEHIDIEELMSAIADVRRKGISENVHALDGGRETHAIAMLMPRGVNGELYSVGVAGPKDRVGRRRLEIIDAMRRWLDSSSKS